MSKPKFTDGGDYDPATDELLYDSKGNPIDQAYLDAAAEQIEAGPDLTGPSVRYGRPSLTGASSESPQIRVRVTPALRERLKAKAKAEHTTVSEVTRKILESAV